MIVKIINGCVLFSHGANWATAPACQRIWETEIAESLPGAEARQALRATPRRSLTFTITAATLQERSRLDARLDAAKVSGYACAPLHGRAAFLAAATAAGVNTLTLASSSWAWAAGDYAILIADDLTYDVQPVVGVDNTGLVLTLAGNTTYGWAAGALCWPLLFGKFSAGKEMPLNAWLAHQPVTIKETVSSRAAQIGATPAQPPGVGQQAIGSTNVIG